MKGDTRLDYAEFQLTPKRTRCELFVSADGLMEKLASGFVKPFITHLRAAEAQVARGNQVIRLETEAGYEKHSLHQQTNNAWFCKGTIERFVRFVSTPEVIERVKTIEDEVIQLEQVRSALVNTFAQTPDKFGYANAATGHQRSRDGTNVLMPSRFSIDKEDNEPDFSKKELLRAMEARLNALHQEQNVAFSRANAAGFDNANIADLMTFAEHFGADRLHDSCSHFLALSRKKIVPKEGQECTSSPTFETPSDATACTLASAFGPMLVPKEEAWLQSAKRKLEFGVNKLQTAKSGGPETKSIDPAKKDLSQKWSTTSPANQAAEITGGSMFLTRLQQMAHQVDGRSSADFGWQMDGENNELAVQDSKDDADSSYKNRPERSTSLPPLRVRTEGSRVWSPSSAESATIKEEDQVRKGKDNTGNPDETSSVESNNQSTPGDVPARRLSVQAAISLFESKKKDTNEAPFRKLTKQESRKTMTESGNSPSEKSVLKRWTGQSPRSPESSGVQEKKTFDSEMVETNQQLDLVKASGEPKEISSSQTLVDGASQPTHDEQARENFKKSLSSLLQLESVQHPDRSSKPKSMDADVQHVKHLSPPVQQPSNSTGKSNMRLDLKNLSSIDQSVPMTKMDAEIPFKAESEAATLVTPATINLLKKPVTEMRPIADVKPDNLPVPPRTSVEYNAQLKHEQKDKEMLHEQEFKDKAMLKIHNPKGLPPKASELVSHRSKFASQVPEAAPLEQEKMRPLATAAPQPEKGLDKKTEKGLDKKTETMKPKEVPTIERQTGRNASFGKMTLQKKMSSSVQQLPTNLLASSVDFHMQALVQMVEHQYTNVSFNGLDTANQQKGEQRGRFYDHYSKLRDAKLRGEHPAKRAEKEAKLRSMQETLERRKAEMKTKSVRLSRNKVRDANAADLVGERRSINTGLTAAMAEQKDLQQEEDDTDQEEYSLKPQAQILDYSDPTSPVSTPPSSKGLSSSFKSRPPNRTVPTLPKSLSGSRNAARGGLSSPKSIAKNPGGPPSQGRSSSLSTSSGDTTAIKSVLNTKDVSKSSFIRTGGSARVHPRLNVSPSEAATLVYDPNNGDIPGNNERRDPKTPLITRKNVASIAVSRSLSTDAAVLLGSPKDQQEGVSDATDGRTAQEAKPFLRKGRGIGPGAGPGIMKQKASILADISKNSDEDTTTECKQDEVFADSEYVKSTPENTPEVFENDELSIVKDQDSSSTTCLETLPPAVNDESASQNSRPSTGRTESGDVEMLEDLPGSASENETPGSDTITSDEKPEESGTEVIDSAPQGSFLQVLNHKQKEGTFLLSDLLSQRNSDSSSNNAGHVTSSISFREASLLPHGQTGSPFPASMSHPYSSLLQRGAVSSRFSPPRVDLSSSGPAVWNGSQSSKYMQEAEAVHSSRRSNGQPKQSSMFPLPPKEPSKGFKRLLHFGRKSRPETTTDCVSVSTTSEGDDDTDEAREPGSQLSDELLQKIRMQKRGYEYGNMGDQYSYSEQDTSQFFGSAIPPPPANFKLREEHLSGGNLIKAPRSFFSLSSFRSKGSEGKSR